MIGIRKNPYQYTLAIADRFTLSSAKNHVQQSGSLVTILSLGNMDGMVSCRLIMCHETVGFALSPCCGVGRGRVHDCF